MIHLQDDILEQILLTLASSDGLKPHILGHAYNHDNGSKLPTTRLHRGVARLARVSRQWKYILYGTGRFWLTELLLVIPTLTSREKRVEDWVLVNDWKERLVGSKLRNGSLDVKIHYRCLPRFFGKEIPPGDTKKIVCCLLMLLQHCDRICRMWLIFPLRQPMIGIINDFKTLRRLEQLAIWQGARPRLSFFSVVQDMLDLKHACRLTRLEIQGHETVLRILPTGHSPIEYLHTSHATWPGGFPVGSPEGHALQLVRCMSNIHELDLLPLHLDAPADFQIPGPTVLHHLTRLTIRMTFQSYHLFLLMFDLPKITHLDITFIATLEGPPADGTSSLSYSSFPKLVNLKVTISESLDMLFFYFLRATATEAKLDQMTVIYPDFDQDSTSLLPLQDFGAALRVSAPNVSIGLRETPGPTQWTDTIRYLASSLEDLNTLSISRDGIPYRSNLLGVIGRRRRQDKLTLPNLVELEIANFSALDVQTICSTITAPKLTRIVFPTPTPTRPHLSYCYPFLTIREDSYLQLWTAITSLSVALLEVNLETFDNPLKLFPQLKELRLFISSRKSLKTRRRRVLCHLMSQPLLVPKLSLLEVILWSPSQTTLDGYTALLQNMMEWRSKQNAPIQKVTLGYQMHPPIPTGTANVWSSDQPREKGTFLHRKYWRGLWGRTFL